jgi:putative oxygen-independent coproporphyrinogen III oxidase
MPALAERLTQTDLDAAPERGFGVYVHWPFCLAKCPYCDFNSHVRAGVDHARWRKALLAEIDHAAARAGRRSVTSIFFGGGTPSLMEPATVAAVIERVDRHWPGAADAEITLEANPTSVEAGRLAAFRAAGVNRVSLGVQSLDDASLKFLGRGHNAAEAIAAVALAARIFPRFSFDLIYARPEQSVAAWRAELAQALAMAGDHLSLYTLTIEASTAFGARAAKGELSPMPEDDMAPFFEATQEICAAAGLPAYEISNHARPGGGAALHGTSGVPSTPGGECRHNLTYWRYGDYLGIGPGAHGRITVGPDKIATRGIKRPESWLEQVEKTGHGGEVEEVIDADERGAEALLMGLRLGEGIHLDNFRAAVGRPLDSFTTAAKLDRLIAGGFLRHTGSRLMATAKGLPVLNSVVVELLR